MFEASKASGSKRSILGKGLKCSGSKEKARETLLKACGRMDTGVLGGSPLRSGSGTSSTREKRNSLGIRTTK